MVTRIGGIEDQIEHRLVNTIAIEQNPSARKPVRDLQYAVFLLDRHPGKQGEFLEKFLAVDRFNMQRIRPGQIKQLADQTTDPFHPAFRRLRGWKRQSESPR